MTIVVSPATPVVLPVYGTTAIDIIQDAFERCNRLSPGETLSADDAELGLRRLNLLVDEMAGKSVHLYLASMTSAPASGPIQLGVGAWATVAPGTEIVSATADNNVMTKITMQQYNELYQPNSPGMPSFWAQDGVGSVYFWPVPTGNIIKILTRGSVARFVDFTTNYIAPPGVASALGAALAVRIAPNVRSGGVTADMMAAEKALMGNISCFEPAIVDTYSYTGYGTVYPPRLF